MSGRGVGEPLSDRTTIHTVKHEGGHIMVWGCMGWDGVGVLTEVQDMMDAQQYVGIWSKSLPESMEKLDLSPEEFIFQWDNDSKHTSKRATKWFEDHDIHVLVWAAHFPDLNLIEHLCHHLKSRLHHYPT
jgi:hypothetical protein